MKSKKILAMMLATILMILPHAGGIAHAAFSDTAGTKYEEAVSVLSALEIVNGFDEEQYMPEEFLTRAEMTAILIRALRMEDCEEERTPFTDVSEEHWAYYPITAANSLGLVSGMGGGIFMPDAEVTASQAIKMVVSLLGYDVKAEAAGGYPAGYIMEAAGLDLLSGIESGDVPISRGDMALLMYRALSVPLFERMSYGEDAYVFSPAENETLLSAYMHIEKPEGRIDAAYSAEISAPGRKLRQDEISVLGEIFSVGESDAALRVGEKAELYVRKEDDGTKTVLIAVPKSETISINAASILDNTTKDLFCYENADGKEEKVSINGASVIYNGMPKADFNALTLQPDTGSVKLIIDGGTVKYIFVEAYENYQIKQVNKTGLILTFFENRLNKSDISFDNSIQTVFTDATGAPCTVANCEKENILSVAESENGKYRKAVLSKAVIAGALTETAENVIKIGDAEYTVSESLRERPDFVMPAIGSSQTFALNMAGQIAGLCEAKSTDTLYGWLRSAQMTKGLSARPQFKIFTQNGEMKIFDTTEKVDFNGENIDAALLLPTKGNALYDGKNAIEQLVKFRLLDEKVTEINTAEDLRRNYDAAHRQDVFSLDAYLKPGYKLDDGTDAWMMFMGGTLKTFGRNWMVRDETAIFVLPGSNLDKDFYIKKASTMKHGTDYTEIYDDVSMFDITDEQVISAMIWDRRDEANAGLTYPEQESPFAIITGNVRMQNDDGETVYKLSYTSSYGSSDAFANEDFEVLFKEASTDIEKDPVLLANSKVRPETVSPAVLNIGDVVQMETDQNNNLIKMSVLFRAETPGDYEQLIGAGKRKATTKHENYGRLISFGTVEEVATHSLISRVNLLDTKTDGPSNQTVITAMIYPRTILECDRNKGTVKAISEDQISIGDRALYVTKTTVPVMIVVYK